jgi:uncharacterized protein YecE (DUF72 family)
VFLVGTSGWSYDDWVGPVYPEALKDRKGAWLEHYGQRFATVEINSTFYRLPPERTVEGWVEKGLRLRPFEFSLKVPQEVTHTAMVQGDRAMVRDLLEQFTAEVCVPLAEAGLLGAALLQLSPHLHGGEGQLGMLADVLAQLRAAGVPSVVEFRHRTWLEGRTLSPAAMDLLRAEGAALCAVDGPSFPPLLRPTGADHAYVRFHGRRADAWFARGAARETEDGLPARYDYLYAQEELQPWARVLRDNERAFERIRVYFNNHPRGQAVRNGEQMMALLDAPRPPPAAGPPPPAKPRPQRRLGEFEDAA